MSVVVYFERIQRLDELISKKATGTPQELASKIGISKRMLHEYLLVMKDMGASIQYCRYSQSYIYSDNMKLEIKFRKNN